MSGLIVGYYTAGTPYEQEAHERLIPSCERLGLDRHVAAVPNLGSWQQNTQFKASYLLAAREIARGPLLYVDCDAVIHSDPWPHLEGIDADVAVHYRNDHELLSGTIWLADNVMAMTLLDDWADRCAQQPDAWDQQVLAVAVDSLLGLRVHRLDARMCMIFDSMRSAHPDVKPVIEHFQASRRFKEKV